MKNSTLSKIQEMRAHFNWDKSDTPEFLISALGEEVKELEETEVGSQAFKDELADVLMYALALCIDNKLDPNEIIESKIKEVLVREY